MDPGTAWAILRALACGDDPADIMRRFWVSLAEIERVCGESPEGHLWEAIDNGEAGRYMRVWRVCRRCDAVEEADNGS
jgi:hypothetical protein